MLSKSSRFVLGVSAVATAAVAVAQAGQQPANSAAAKSASGRSEPWVAPGTPGSPIKGELFHAQVLMSAHGFSPGVIDGKEGESFKLALSSFQESRGLESTGKLDGDTRRAMIDSTPSTVMVRLGPDEVRSHMSIVPQEPRSAGRAQFLGYRT